MAVRKKNEWSQAKEVIEIAENTPYRTRSSLPSLSAHAPAANLGIDATRFLSHSIPDNPSTARVEMNRGVVSRIGERRRPSPHLGVIDATCDAHITPSRAVALHARMAQTREDVVAAKHLVRRRYAWRGYDIPTDDHESLRAAFAGDSSEVVLVAVDAGAVIGTVTMGFDGAGGLLAEGSYQKEIDEHRAAGSQLCEVTRLAVAEQADSKPVLAALFGVLLAIGRARGVTQMFIEVNPRHVVFYRRVLGFRVAGGERFCERAKAPSVLLCVEMDEFEQRVMSFNAKIAPESLEARAA